MERATKKSDRLLPWLRLGEAIHEATQPTRPPSIGRPARDNRVRSGTSTQGSRDVETRLAEVEKVCHGDDGWTYRIYLQSASDKPAERMVLCVLAFVIWARFGNSNGYDTMLPHLATRLAPLVPDKPTLEAILYVRQVIADMLRLGTIVVRDQQVFITAVLADTVCGHDHHLATPMSPPLPPFGQHCSSKRTNPNNEKEFVALLKKMEVLKPAELDKLIVAQGYVSQAQARRAICLSAYRHVRRLKSLHIEKRKVDELPKHDCVLLMGPSGCGKTHLLETVFQKMFHLPVVIWNTPSITEAGYIGGKVEHIVKRLLEISDDNIHLAQAGVICLDEIDKIASVGGEGTMPGERLNRDVSGGDVQKQLLKVFEGAPISVSSGQLEFSSRDNLIIGSGAFSVLQNRRHNARLGFGATGATVEQGKQDGIVDKLSRYGFMVEFIGRFTSIVQFNALSKADLRTILENTVIVSHQTELKAEGIGLSVHVDVLDFLVAQAWHHHTGARGLATCLMQVLQDALFDAYSEVNVKAIALVMDGDQVRHEIIRRKARLNARRSADIPQPEDHAPQALGAVA